MNPPPKKKEKYVNGIKSRRERLNYFLLIFSYLEYLVSEEIGKKE